jgi:hypothetical protein
MFSKAEFAEKTKSLVNIFCYSEIEKFKVELANAHVFKYQLTDVH